MRLLICCAVCIALACPSFASAEGGENNVPPKGFKALFNGKSLDGWRGLSHPQSNPYKLAAMSEEDRNALYKKNWEEVIQHWTIEDGDLVNDGHGFYLTTLEEFSNYELWVDYKTVPQADSGIYLKYNPQVQIWDYTEAGGKWKIGADKGSGGLWNNSKGAPGKDPSSLADKPFGEWNRFRIIQLGARTWVWLNGKAVVENATHENFWNRKNPLISKGAIQLQTHGGEIRWKNIFIREIGSDEANSTLAGSADGFKSIFNGSDLSGWAGPTGNYEVVDGAIRCKPRSGGTIYWNTELSDFVARLEFKLPPGGNNGLAIRYPGKGDTAYVGMTELQVLDNTAAKYAKLDKRQYHGSAYGMVASHRGYQRPVGEWNYQEVTVQGSTIKVELNGSMILNADLAAVKEFMGGKPHPGMGRTSGFFGFAGHGDPVQFRNVRIRQLPGN
ncbi:MAG: DUF1080 domain-containing protein [Planctomycetaceae bacterium]